MSENKFKYFTVTTTAIVKATTKSDAEAIASGRRVSAATGKALYRDVVIERISAIEAHDMAAG